MLCLGGFELFSRWVSLTVRRYSVFDSSIHSRTCLPVHLWFSSWLRPALLGSVGPSTETFTAYFKRLEQFFEANSINHYPADATAAVIQAGNKKNRCNDFRNR